MSIPNDILIEEIWKYLPVKILLKYCALNKTINQICDNNETWISLIKRDLEIDYFGNDAKEEYKRLLLFTNFTKNYNIDFLDLNLYDIGTLYEITRELEIPIMLSRDHYEKNGYKLPLIRRIWEKLEEITPIPHSYEKIRKNDIGPREGNNFHL